MAPQEAINELKVRQSYLADVNLNGQMAFKMAIEAIDENETLRREGANIMIKNTALLKEYVELRTKLNETDEILHMQSDDLISTQNERNELEKALELAVDSEASSFCVFNGIEEDLWPEYCPNPPETEHATCVKCWKEYYLSKAKEATNAEQIPE